MSWFISESVILYVPEVNEYNFHPLNGIAVIIRHHKAWRVIIKPLSLHQRVRDWSLLLPQNREKAHKYELGGDDDNYPVDPDWVILIINLSISVNSFI